MPTRLKANRPVNPDRNGLRAVTRGDTNANGGIVHLRGYGLIRLFKIVAPDGDIEWWASNDLTMKPMTRVRFAGYAWTIEHYHRGIKPFCDVERAQVRAARAQRNHIGLALRAFLRLESHGYHRGISWFEAKHAIIRDAVRAYLAKPLYQLVSTA
jgi:putative transposase